ncbi:MAG: Radical SAM superfamily protein [Methanosaeta sp. PtaB.Bin039]|nr:MAG: Radical SAM superfamily protein [Methanosaeta sp. PtaB.Bin039]OPY47009.1 MAG: Radical SAM superfamily protein [Methanosaeta sp. PtaU1.Bin028]HOT07067.1 radical SAM protein [Methanotrichaceae archaeon]HQF17098.1 radical SAM protein [Methanotrichaceae archaeon]HQI91719.1 radical SAM protein [Methanotrichaceae archaeon]
MSSRVLFATVYKNRDTPYDYIGANSRSRWFRFYWPRIQSFGLRFLKQNIPELEILEFPTWEEYLRKLEEGWDVLGLSFYLSETHEALEMVEAARARGIPEIWAGNYGALTPEIQGRFDRVFVGYSEQQLAPYFGRQVEKIVHPPLIEYLNTPFGIKLNIYGILFTTRGCGVGCKFCQTPCFAPRPSTLPLESIERVVAYYKKNDINVVLIEDENFGANRRQAERVVEILDDYDMVWGCMARADFLRDKIDEWAQMRRRVSRRDGSARRMVSGFAGAAIGIETLHQQTLDSIKKKEGAEEIVDTVKLLQRNGMGIVGYYMIGFEEDTVSSVKEDIKRLADLKLDITQICVLTPLPQTPIWTEIKDRYGIFDHDYHHYDGKHLVWNHPHIQPQEMDDLLDWSLKTVYPWSAPLRTSYRVWHNAYRYAGMAGLREVASYIRRANRFDFYPKEPRLLV